MNPLGPHYPTSRDERPSAVLARRLDAHALKHIRNAPGSADAGSLITGLVSRNGELPEHPEACEEIARWLLEEGLPQAFTPFMNAARLQSLIVQLGSIHLAAELKNCPALERLRLHATQIDDAAADKLALALTAARH